MVVLSFGEAHCIARDQLWDGSVADDAEHDPSTEAIRAFNNFVHEDLGRFDGRNWIGV